MCASVCMNPCSEFANSIVMIYISKQCFITYSTYMGKNQNYYDRLKSVINLSDQTENSGVTKTNKSLESIGCERFRKVSQKRIRIAASRRLFSAFGSKNLS